MAELRANPTVRVAALARAFGVSTETVRRDLDALSEGGLVSRTYGGAALPAIGVEPSLAQRQRELTAERERIARHAVGLVAARDVLMIDCGSTTWQFARRLATLPMPLTVITNSLGVASTLAANPAIRVVIRPGDYAAGEGGTFGPGDAGLRPPLSRRQGGDRRRRPDRGRPDRGPARRRLGQAGDARAGAPRDPRSTTASLEARYELVCPLAELADLVTDARRRRCWRRRSAPPASRSIWPWTSRLVINPPAEVRPACSSCPAAAIGYLAPADIRDG